jgi:hypothetical protein
MKSALVIVSLPLLLVALTASPRLLSAQPSAAVASMERKLHHIQSNARLAHPDPTPTTFTEQEINAYLASGALEFPAGVQSVRFQGQPGIVTASTRVDFDRLRAGVNSSNPLLSIFTGVHDVIVISQAQGRGGKAFVHVDSVSLDGVEIPRFVLQLFVDKYLRPRYPQVGLDSQFVLPGRIDSAVIGSHTLTLTQK